VDKIEIKKQIIYQIISTTYRGHCSMGKKLLSKGFQGVLDRDSRSLKMKLYYVLNFNIEIL